MIRANVWVSFLFAGLPLFSTDVQPPSLRLDGSAVPQRYRLDLTIDPAQDRFQGSIEIDINLNGPTSVIWLNGTELQVSDASIRSRNGAARRARAIGPGKDFLGLQTDAVVPAGPATIRIVYSAAFRKQGVAGVLTRQDSGDWYAFSDFEPIDARTAFPCFDEPIYKAPWHITLRVPSGMKAFSNARQLSESSTEHGRKTVRFHPTAPISTYLVAFAVGPFEVVDAGYAGKKKTPLRIIVPKGRSARTTFARDATPKIFEALEDYFGIPYPFDKLDQVAFPFNFGAMENAGLITYGQSNLVAPPTGEFHQHRLNSATIIAHEIAHQWFGNLTTMRWWDDLWLNEAFADWMEVQIVARVFPEWNAPVFLPFVKAFAISKDSLTSARRIRQPIENAGDIGQAFDGITYNKGAAVIGMFESFIGPAKFRTGIQSYLRKHAWKNTTASDFLSALSAAAGKDMSAPFSTFLDRPGAPLLRVRLECNGGASEVSISQERFLPLGSKGERKQSWQVPVCIRYGTDGAPTTECTLLTDPRQTIRLQKAKSCPTWIDADAGAVGYYRVSYEGDLAARLAKAPSLSPIEQADLILNVRSLFEAGAAGPEQALLVAIDLSSSSNPTTVQAGLDIFIAARALVTEEQLGAFERLVSRTYARKARSLGWRELESDDPETRLLRSRLWGTVLNLGGERDLDEQARNLTLQWLADRKSIDPGMVAAITRAVAGKADREMYQALRRGAEELSDVTERGLITRALGWVQDPMLARETLQWILTTTLSANERLAVLAGMSFTAETARILWQFIQQNYPALIERMPRGQTMDRGAVLIELVGGMCDQTSREEVQSFFSERVGGISGGPRALAQTLERIDLCVARKAALGGPMAAYLAKQP